MECHYHPDVKAVTTCKICGQPICNKCSIKMTGGDIWCYSCLKKSEENNLKWLKNFRIIAIIGGILGILILFLNIKEHGTGGIIRGLIIGFFVACLPISYFYNFKYVLKSPEAAKTSVIIKFIVMLILGPFVLIKAIKYYKDLERGLKNNKEVEKELEEANTKGFCEKNEPWILDIEVRAKELEKKYNVEDMRIFKDRCIFMKEVIEDAKNIKEGENGKIKDEVLKNYEERLEKVIERKKTLEKKYPSSISNYDKLAFQKVKKMNYESDKKKRKKTKQEEEHIEEKKDLYIEIILDIENKVKKLEENYNIEDVEKVKANLDFWTRFIRIWKLKKEHNYGKEDDEVLEIFDERLKKLEEKIKTLESKY